MAQAPSTLSSPRAVFEPSGTIDGALAAARRLVAEGARTLQIFAAVGNDWQAAAFDPAFAGLGVPCFGGVFPAVIFGGRSVERGTAIVGHEVEAQIEVLHFDALDADVRGVEAFEAARTLFVYFDATGPSGELVTALYETLGTGPSWVGGGAGALDFLRRPVVITPSGLAAGVAVVAGFAAPARLGVTHGWEAIGSPLQVTASEGNDVLQLEWRAAFDVYREVVEAHSGKRFADHDFFALAKVYPLVVERLGSEGVVRDPLAVLPSGALRCAGDVPPHTTVRIATGTPEGMLNAAAAAREQASGAGVPGAGVALTIDCISRALVLGERHAEELAALEVPGLPQVGALTLGEIASSRKGFLQLHNKTTVLALLG
jgi:hypothetical protein